MEIWLNSLLNNYLGETMNLIKDVNTKLFKNVYIADESKDFICYHLIDDTQIYELTARAEHLFLTSAPTRFNRLTSVRTIFEGQLTPAALQDAVGLLHDNKNDTFLM
jgi:hypothetical protein